jgi:HSP20 family protein
MTRFRPSEWRREIAVPLQALQGELNRLFEEYWDPERGTPGKEPTDLAPEAWSPAVDLDESPHELVLRIDLPGVDPSSVDLSLTGTVLTLKGERPETPTAEGASSRLRERPAGAFLRRINLPDDVAFEGVQAECKHGVLIVRLPKHDKVRPRTIPIRPN